MVCILITPFLNMAKNSDVVLIRTRPDYVANVGPVGDSVLWTRTDEIDGQKIRVTLGTDARVYLTCLQGTMKLLSFRLRPWAPRSKRFFRTVELPEEQQIKLNEGMTVGVTRTGKTLNPEELICYFAVEMASGKQCIILVNSKIEKMWGMNPVMVFD